LKRKYHEVEYERWRGDGREWIIFKDRDVPNVIKTRFAEKELEAIESEFGSIYDITDAEIDRMAEDLAIADTKRKQHRVSSSRNFHSKQCRRGNTNENNENEDENKEKSICNIENIESNGRDTPKYDMVVLKGNYQELLQKLRERGYQALDTSGGDEVTHRLAGKGRVTEQDLRDMGFKVEKTRQLKQKHDTS